MKFEEVPKSRWPSIEDGLEKVWLNNHFLVQVYREKGTVRISVNKTKGYVLVDDKPVWQDGITWDELQEIKDSIGFEDKWFCELYPPSNRTINVANLRHLWLIETPSYGWKVKRQPPSPKGESL